jgi:hypothetical protein
MQPQHTIGDLKETADVVRERADSDKDFGEMYEEARRRARVRDVYPPALADLESADGTRLVPSVGPGPIPPQP